MLTRARDARLGRTPEAETPYRKAQEMWDRRMGSSLAQARTWRLTAFAALGLAGLLGASTIALALRPAAVPFVIEASQTGEARLVGPANAAYQPNDAQISYHLARFIELVRGLPSDPVVVRQNWLRAYDWTTQSGAQALNAMGRERDPLNEVGRTTVSVEVLSVVRASDNSFNIRWREKAYASGMLTSTERYSGVATIVLEQPTTPDGLSRNPLGLYVHAFTWSRDLQQ